MVRRLGYGYGGDSHQPVIDDTAMDRFGIEDEGLKRLIDAVQADLDDGESILSDLVSLRPHGNKPLLFSSAPLP